MNDEHADEGGAHQDQGPSEAAASAGVLAFLALTELSSFERFATDSQFAPTLRDRVELGRLAAQEFGMFELLSARIVALGHDPLALIVPMEEPFRAFQRQTQPSDWYESLMRTYVVDSIFRDVHREIIGGLDEDSRATALQVLDHTAPAEHLARRLGEAVNADELLAGRLALWGRRLVAEAIHRGKETLLRPGSGLADRATAADEEPAAAVTRIMSAVTEAHSRRMSVLGLVA